MTLTPGRSPTRSNDDGDNYNYYESKNILKKARKNMPITIHHRRGDIGSEYDTPSKHERSSSYTKTKTTQKYSNLNNTYTDGNVLNNLNKSKPGTGANKGGNKYTQSTYQIKTSSITSGGRGSGPESGVGKGSSSYSEYRKYEQRGNINNGRNSGGFNQNTNNKYGTRTENLSRYQLNQSTDNRRGGPYFGGSSSQYQFNQSNEYRYGGINMGGFSQYQNFDDSEFIIIDCPVHGRQTVRRDRFKKFY